MKQVFVRSGIALFLLVIFISGSSFKRSTVEVNAGKGGPETHSVPLKGKFTITFIEGGIEGVGESSCLGRFTLLANDNEDNFPVLTGVLTITAANGDQLFVTHSGFAQDLGNGMLQVDFVNSITGGTGRFAGATGSFDTHASVSDVAGGGSSTLEGTINF
jgi:hypothetical protein